VSQESVELARSAFEASSRGDPTAAQDAFDPAMEWDMTGVAGWAEKDIYRGADEIVPFLLGWANAWRDWHYDIDEVRDAGERQVFLAIHEWATGVESDAAVDQRRYFAVEVDQGLIARVRMFSDRADALKAAGLED
jgi:ketosteroid isomerase-like protein